MSGIVDTTKQAEQTKHTKYTKPEAVLVLRSDLEKLEAARVILCNYFDKTPQLLTLLDVTLPMWTITHRKVPRTLKIISIRATSYNKQTNINLQTNTEQGDN